MRRQFLVEPVSQRPVQPAQQECVEIEGREIAKPRQSMEMGPEPIFQTCDQALIIRRRPDIRFQPVHQLEARLKIARSFPSREGVTDRTAPPPAKPRPRLPHRGRGTFFQHQRAKALAAPRQNAAGDGIEAGFHRLFYLRFRARPADRQHPAAPPCGSGARFSSPATPPPEVLLWRADRSPQAWRRRRPRGGNCRARRGAGPAGPETPRRSAAPDRPPPPAPRRCRAGVRYCRAAWRMPLIALRSAPARCRGRFGDRLQPRHDVGRRLQPGAQRIAPLQQRRDIAGACSLAAALPPPASWRPGADGRRACSSARPAA